MVSRRQLGAFALALIAALGILSPVAQARRGLGSVGPPTAVRLFSCRPLDRLADLFERYPDLPVG